MFPSLVGARSRALLTAATVATGVVLAAAPATAADAAPAAQHSSSTSTAARPHSESRAEVFAQRAAKVLKEVRAQKGKPYSYGAAGPHSFDCSGLVMYVFRHALGRHLPRTAEDQKHYAARIQRRHARPGDLVFQVDSSGYAFHVGIFAGHGYFWNAPHSGSHVRKEKLWRAAWRFGRVIKS
jgi:cell wall-associated NlpC family hydrolase